MTFPLRQTSRFARPTLPFALVFRPTAATSFRVAWKSVLRPEFPSKRSSLIRGWPQREALRFSRQWITLEPRPRLRRPHRPLKPETQCSQLDNNHRGLWPTRGPLYWGITATWPLSISLSITQSPLPCPRCRQLTSWAPPSSLKVSYYPCRSPWPRRPRPQPPRNSNLKDALVARRWTHAITPTILRPHLLLRWNFDLIFPVSVMLLPCLPKSNLLSDAQQ